MRTKIADHINEFVNIPILFTEEEEKKIFLKMVDSLDIHLYKFMPKEILDIANDPKRGIADAVIDMLKDNLVPILASAVPLPFVPNGVKEMIIDMFLNIVLQALRRGSGIDQVLNNLRPA